MSEQSIRPMAADATAPRTATTAGSSRAVVREAVSPEARAPLPEQAKPDLDRFVAQLNMLNRSIGRDLRFEVDLENGISVIQVLDRETGEIIRQIPPEKLGPQSTSASLLDVRLYDELV